VLTLSAFRAMEYLEAGQVAEALKEMEQAVVSHSWNAIDLDGFLTVLADVLHQAGHTLDAMTCLLMSWHLRGQQSIHCQPVQLGCVVAGMSHDAVTSAGAKQFAVAIAVVSGLQLEWVASLLKQMLGEEELTSRLEQQIGFSRANPLICRLVTNRLIEMGLHAAVIESSYLLNFPGSETQQDVQFLNYQLLLVLNGERWTP